MCESSVTIAVLQMPCQMELMLKLYVVTKFSSEFMISIFSSI